MKFIWSLISYWIGNFSNFSLKADGCNLKVIVNLFPSQVLWSFKASAYPCCFIPFSLDEKLEFLMGEMFFSFLSCCCRWTAYVQSLPQVGKGQRLYDSCAYIKTKMGKMREETSVLRWKHSTTNEHINWLEMFWPDFSTRESIP